MLGGFEVWEQREQHPTPVSVGLTQTASTTAKMKEQTMYSHLLPTHSPPCTAEMSSSPFLLPPALSDSCPHLPLLCSSLSPLHIEQKHPPKKHQPVQYCSVIASA